MQQITSAHNSHIKHLLTLKDASHRTKSKLYLIEGLREVLRFFIGSQAQHINQAKGQTLHSLYISHRAIQNGLLDQIYEQIDRQGLTTSLFKKSIFQISDLLFEKISFRESPDGVLAIAPQQVHKLIELKWSEEEPLRFLVAQSIEKPGNLGALLRLADATGVKAVLLADRRTDMWNPNVIRASMGSFFQVPIFQLSSQQILDYLIKNSVQVVATCVDSACLYWNVNYQKKFALVVGAEDVGLSAFWHQASILQVKLPMLGMADSLNVSTAAAVGLYEALRQHSNLNG
jgi:TrmH family RNA methyltransferase